jgi:hypothetical protein
LSFTQLEHWRNRQALGGRPIRQVALATRLRERISPELLDEALRTVGNRHEALRTRIVLCDGVSPQQEIVDEYRSELEIIRISSVARANRAKEIERQIQRVILDARDYATSPLFKAALICVEQSDHVLILALDHIISDFASLNILHGEILTAYEQLLGGGPIVLPKVAIQYPEYAALLRGAPMEHLAASRERLASIPRTCFPDDPDIELQGRQTGWGVARFVIGLDLRRGLGVWAQRHGTTMVMVTLAAYAALVLRWCAVRETIIGFMIDGRFEAGLERTVGYLAFPLYIRVSIGYDTTFLDVLRQVIEDRCRAYDEADFNYASTQMPPPAFTRNTVFNWLPPGDVSNFPRKSADARSAEPLEFSNPVFQGLGLDQEPFVLLADTDETILGMLSYPRHRFSDGAMGRFAGSIVSMLERLIQTPNVPVMGIDLK